MGSICALKNQNALIRSLDPLAETRDFQLVFLGHAQPDVAYADEFIRLVQARAWYVWAGFADREQLKGWLHETALLALPSLEDNCPMAVLEAMAAGVPVVAARVGGVPDLIEEERTGFLCEPTDGASMRKAIEKALAAPGAAAEVGRQAKSLAKERFHPNVTTRRHLEVYREVLT